MTIQKRTLISPKDLLGIEYECNHCRARYSVPIDRLDRVTMACPNCKEPWFDHKMADLAAINVSQDIVHRFVDHIKALRSCQLEGVALRLEIRADEEAAK
jgi:hypothetical protein